MSKLKKIIKPYHSLGIWDSVARFVLSNRLFILLILMGVTAFLATQIRHIHITHTEANMLPQTHHISKEYSDFVTTFGKEGNLLVIAADIDQIFTLKNFQMWNELGNELGNKAPYVTSVTSLHTIKELVRNEQKENFTPKGLYQGSVTKQAHLDSLKVKLTNKLPVYEGIVYNKAKNSLRMVIALDENIIDTAIRKDFIINEINPIVERYQKEISTPLHISGSPYIRTIGTDIITKEIPLFIVGALLVTSLVFFFFFRTIAPTIISMIAVLVGVVWSAGLMGLLGYEITILTSVIPPLVIVIGVPNCIFLINKYHQEIRKHQFKAMALQRVVAKVGNVTLLTNFTTALGFATFTITGNKILEEFGVVAALSIMGLFIISLMLVPIIYSYIPKPQEKNLLHLEKNWVERLYTGIEKFITEGRTKVYWSALGLFLLGVWGISMIQVSGSTIEDLPKGHKFYRDIEYFQEHYGGITPLEITVHMNRKNGVIAPITLEKLEQFEEFLGEIPEISQPLSIMKLVKYARQAYYNGNSEYYGLPTSQERSFILSYMKNSGKAGNALERLTDSLSQTARISIQIKEMGAQQMQALEQHIYQKAQELFPANQYKVNITGKAYLFTKGTSFLVKNLFESLMLAVVLIALIMLLLFRSVRMVVISLIPNLLPLIMTAGVMGFLGIPLKPSTILVFGIAFGISVDDTIHLLAKYRQELQRLGDMKAAVYSALEETAISMFYTSVVLFFGFLVFVFSDFGGTKALGGLVAATLFFAVFSNLILLPALLLTFEKIKRE